MFATSLVIHSYKLTPCREIHSSLSSTRSHGQGSALGGQGWVTCRCRVPCKCHCRMLLAIFPGAEIAANVCGCCDLVTHPLSRTFPPQNLASRRGFVAWALMGRVTSWSSCCNTLKVSYSALFPVVTIFEMEEVGCFLSKTPRCQEMKTNSIEENISDYCLSTWIGLLCGAVSYRIYIDQSCFCLSTMSEFIG